MNEKPDNLPDLPAPYFVHAFDGRPAFSASLMNSYGQRCREQGRAEGLEQAASAIEGYPEWIGPQAKKEIAAAIRALKG